MTNKPALIVSPAGTSLLTNCIETPEERRILRECANSKKGELTSGEIAAIQKCATQAAAILAAGNDANCKAAGAEINGLLTYLEQYCQVNYGLLIFIQTATYMSEVVIGLLRKYLEQRLPTFTVDVWDPVSLSTKTKADFLAGINDIVKRCEDNLPGWRDTYHVVFNLTGGFKSVQGYLNTLGMLYADEIVYLFENSTEMLRIPKLPITLNIPGFESYNSNINIEQYVPLLALADKNYLPVDSLSLKDDLPEIFFEQLDIDGKKFVGLTPWGTAVWRRIKKDMAAKQLYDLPYLVYADSFKKDFENYSKDKNKRAELLDALAVLSSELLANDGNHDCLKNNRGINYASLKGSQYDHIRINDGDRVSCEKHGNNIIMRHFGAHDDVNNNP